MNSNILQFIKNINFASIVSNTNKTLGIVKKTIPLYKEIRPFINKEKSILPKKAINIDEIKESRPLKELYQTNTTEYNDTLTFFK